LMLPMVLGLSVVQINTFMDSVIAFALVPDGRGLAILGYAQYLYQLPVGVVGVALATAVFPVLASLSATGQRGEFARVMERGLRMSLFVSLPAVVGLVCVASPLVRGLYERGEFRADATARVARALICYSLGIWSYCGQHILVRAFYAVKQSKTPARIAASMILLNLALNLLLVFRMGEAGVALATAISATLQFALLVRGLHPHLFEPRWRHVAGGAVRMSAASVVMGAAVVASQTYGGLGTTWASRSILQVAVIVVGGVIVYAAVCYLLRVEELSQAVRWVRDRRRSGE
jgi:putative peptidoglycan lipid II flippase